MKVLKHSEMTPRNLHGRDVYSYLDLADNVVLRLITMDPGDIQQEDKVPAAHCQYVIKGNLRLTENDGTVHELTAMDAIGYAPGDGRKMENIGTEEAVLLIIDQGSPHDAWGPGGPGGPKAPEA